MTRGDDLIERMLAVPSSAPDVANELLTEMNRGYPVARLDPLLRNPNDDVTEAAAWIASELPGCLGQIVGAAAALIRHPRPAVRFFAVDVVLDNVAEDGELLAETLYLVCDDDSGVRWKAMRFATLADATQLQAAEPFLKSEDSVTLSASGLLAEGDVERREARARRGLRAADPILRRWSASAAARWGSETLLKVATSSDDMDVSTFASRELARLRRFGPARRTTGI